MRNWTIKDAVAVIQNGKDTEAIKEIAKHYPIFFMAVVKNDLGAIAAMMTEKMTVRRLQEADEAEASDAEDIEAEEAEAEDTEDAGDDNDLENMSTKELIQLCGKKGIKVPKYGKNKAFYIAALQGGAEEKEAEDEDSDDGEEEDDPYAGKNAIQLYSLCKKRGIKVQPKQKAAVYLKALKDADAKAEDAEDADGEDWDEEEEAEEKPTKKSAPAKKAPAKEEKKSAKPAKKAEAEDDDDDWDL